MRCFQLSLCLLDVARRQILMVLLQGGSQVKNNFPGLVFVEDGKDLSQLSGVGLNRNEALPARASHLSRFWFLAPVLGKLRAAPFAQDQRQQIEPRFFNTVWQRYANQSQLAICEDRKSTRLNSSHT